MSTKIKVVVLGAAGVGKTSFVLCATHQYTHFEDNGAFAYQPTLGAVFNRLQTYTDEKGRVTHVKREGCPCADAEQCATLGPCVDVWDTAGQERFNSLVSMYTRGAAVTVVMHEGTKSSVQRALAEGKNVKLNNPDAAIFVVQTKSDTGAPFDYSVADELQAQGWAYITTLGKDLSSVHNAMLAIVTLAIERAARAQKSDDTAPLKPPRTVASFSWLC